MASTSPPKFPMKHGYVHPTQTELELTGVRSTTHIGPQGHHVTAYALFENFVRSTEHLPVEECIARIAMIISTMPDIYELARRSFLEHLEEDEGTHFDAVDKEAKEIIEQMNRRIGVFNMQDKALEAHMLEARTPPPTQFKGESLKNALELKKHRLAELTTYLINAYLHIRNKQRYVSFPPVLNPSLKPSNAEGAIVKKANAELQASHSKLRTGEKVSIESITIEIEKLFYYPRVDEAEENREGKPKPYNKKSTFRNNDLQRLYFVTTIHLHTIFYTYPGLAKEKNNIINNFVGKVASQWGWKSNSPERDKFLKEIRVALDKMAKKEALHSAPLRTPDLPSTSANLLSSSASPVDLSSSRSSTTHTGVPNLAPASSSGTIATHPTHSSTLLSPPPGPRLGRRALAASTSGAMPNSGDAPKTDNQAPISTGGTIATHPTHSSTLLSPPPGPRLGRRALAASTSGAMPNSGDAPKVDEGPVFSSAFTTATSALSGLAISGGMTPRVRGPLLFDPKPPSTSFETLVQRELKKLKEEERTDIKDLDLAGLEKYNKKINRKKENLGAYPLNKALLEAYNITLTEISVAIHKNKHPKSGLK